MSGQRKAFDRYEGEIKPQGRRAMTDAADLYAAHPGFFDLAHVRANAPALAEMSDEALSSAGIASGTRAALSSAGGNCRMRWSA